MSADLLLRKFADLENSPGSGGRLRQLVVELALMGRLSGPESSDEPSRTLLDRIRTSGLAARSRGKDLASKTTDADLSAPSRWERTRLGDVISLLSGQHLKPTEYSAYEPGALPYITGPADFGPTGLRITRRAIVRKAVATRGQILLTVKGAGVGKTALCDHEEVAISRQLMALEPIGWSTGYLLLITQRLADQLKTRARSLIPGISRDDVAGFPIALPPLAEQNRIVAKVNELMALCDELEAAQIEREARRDRLRTTSLRNLVAPAALKETTSFFLRNSRRMITKPAHVGDVREAILDLAVRRRLVPRDPEGQVPEVPAIGERTPNSNGRATTITLGDACEKITDGTHRTPTYVSSGVPFISVKDFSAGQLSFASTRYITPTEHSALVRRCDPRRGDVLIGRIGTLGKAVVVDTDQEFSIFVSVGLLRPKRAIVTPEYLKLYLNSRIAHAEYDRIKVGAGTHTDKLNLGDLRRIEVTLPPLTEQHRIVTKVDELMALCDQLEQSLAAEQIERGRLLEALLRVALDGGAVDESV